MNEVLAAVQQTLSVNNGGAMVDVYYTEGKGALFVPGGAELHARNIILAVSEDRLRFMALGVAV